MEIFSKYTKTIGALVAIVASVVSIYFYFHKEQVILEVKTMSIQLLTTPASTDNLRVQYFYNDTVPVQNLWQIQYVIRNIGDATLIGVGENKQLLSKNLPFSIEHEKHIYSIIVTRSNNEASIIGNHLCFKQWRPREFVEIIALVESEESPQLTISDRDIKDAKIVYHKYTPETINEEIRIIDHAPQWLAKTLKIIYFILCGFLTLGVIVTVCQKGSRTNKISIIIGWFILSFPLLWIL